MVDNVQQAAEQFSLGNIEAVSDYLSDNVTWTIPGDRILSGKQQVLEFCSAPCPETCLPFQNKTVIGDDDRMVITGGSESGESAYCDIYVINNNKITEVTSYFIKTPRLLSARINPYLTFNGNCREAMTFYRDCIGGELTLQTIGESPVAERMPAQMKQSILHSTLRNSSFVLMGSDMCDEQGLNRGNAVSLLLDCGSEHQIKDCYERLAQGGEATHKVERTFWGALFGDLVDKYGNRWLLNFNDRQ
jgi:PhnB protein